MFTRMACLAALVFCLAASGCLSSRYADRNSMDEVRKSKEAIVQLNEQMTALNKEIEVLKKELQEIKEEKQKQAAGADRERGFPNDEADIAREKVVASLPEAEKIDRIQEIDILKNEEIQEAPEKKPILSHKDIAMKTLRMKVLSGNGKLSTAREMSTKVSKMGYKIEDIGLASRADFRVNTIYYAPEYQKEAENLASRLGGETIAKRMTWPSVFHIILVAVP